jgi:hypothetical protein
MNSWISWNVGYPWPSAVGNATERLDGPERIIKTDLAEK